MDEAIRGRLRHEVVDRVGHRERGCGRHHRDEARAPLREDRGGVPAGLTVAVAVDQPALGVLQRRPPTRTSTGLLRANGFPGIKVTWLSVGS